MSLPEGNDEVRHARSLPATPNDEHASHFQPASSNDEQAGNDDQVSPSQPETSNKNTSKGNCPCSMKYLKPLDISFTDSKRKLFKESQFLSLLEGMLKGELRENSSNLTLNICKKYTDKKFMLNEGTFISFCVTEVANVLGIRPTGNSMLSKSFKFPTYIDDLKQQYSAKLNNKEKKNQGDKTKIEVTGKAKRELSSHSLKEILKNMPVNNDTEKTQYKKLLLFFIIDQFLLPTSEKAYVRSSMYKHADDLNNFEQINWAQSALDLIHSAAKNVAKGKSNFVACTPVLEAMLFERIKKLQPAQSSKYVSNIPPVFKYKSSRNSFAEWRKKVESLTPSDIVECPHCVRQEVMDAAGEDGHTVLPENTVVEVVGEGENNDLEVAVSPLLDDVGDDEHTVLPENPVAEVVGEGENNDLRVNVSPLSDDVGEGRTDSFDLFANADVEASIQSPLSDESDVVVAAESVFVEQRVVQPPLRCFERKRRRGQKVVGQEGVSAAEPASQGVGAAEAAIVHEVVPAEINRIGSGDLCSSIMVVTASKRKKLRVSYDSKSDDDDVHLRAKSLSTLNLGASSSRSSWVESNEKLYEGQTKVSKSKQEEFESQVKELESKKKQFESQEKVLRLKAKLFERQADNLESFKKHFESQLKRLKSKEKIFERRIKESESKEQHFQRRVKEFESKEEELELRDSQHES